MLKLSQTPIADLLMANESCAHVLQQLGNKNNYTRVASLLSLKYSAAFRIYAIISHGAHETYDQHNCILVLNQTEADRRTLMITCRL